jgi:hypothetical protein
MRIAMAASRTPASGAIADSTQQATGRLVGPGWRASARGDDRRLTSTPEATPSTRMAEPPENDVLLVDPFPGRTFVRHCWYGPSARRGPTRQVARRVRRPLHQARRRPDPGHGQGDMDRRNRGRGQRMDRPVDQDSRLRFPRDGAAASRVLGASRRRAAARVQHVAALVHGGSEGRQLVEHRQPPRLLLLDADRARRIRDRFGEHDGRFDDEGDTSEPRHQLRRDRAPVQHLRHRLAGPLATQPHLSRSRLFGCGGYENTLVMALAKSCHHAGVDNALTPVFQ